MKASMRSRPISRGLIKIFNSPTPRETIQAYVEGGDSSANEAALSVARDRLRGVNRVSLDASGDADLGRQLGDALRKLNLSVADGSDVVVHFNGNGYLAAANSSAKTLTLG